MSKAIIFKTHTGYYGNIKTGKMEAWNGSKQTVEVTLLGTRPHFVIVNKGNYLRLKTEIENGKDILPELKKLHKEASNIALEEYKKENPEKAEIWDQINKEENNLNIENDDDIDLSFLEDENEMMEKSPDGIAAIMDIDKKYSIIYADPPWQCKDKAVKRIGAEKHYSTMSIEEIKCLPIAELCNKDAVLLIWVTMPKLMEVGSVIEAWGFKYKTCAFTWIKENKVASTFFMGAGRYTRSNAEICLLATRGKPLERLSRSIRQVQVHKIEKHSKKPDIFADEIVNLFGDLPRIELFARDNKPGWDGWGKEFPELESQNYDDNFLDFLE